MGTSKRVRHLNDLAAKVIIVVIIIIIILIIIIIIILLFKGYKTCWSKHS